MTVREPRSTENDLRLLKPRLAYLVKMERPFRHSEDDDLIDGVYIDHNGDPVGLVVFADGCGAGPDQFLIVTVRDVGAVHAEGALDSDHRISSYEPVSALVYDPEDTLPRGVERNGDRWDTGSEVIYTFECDEDAILAQSA